MMPLRISQSEDRIGIAKRSVLELGWNSVRATNPMYSVEDRAKHDAPPELPVRIAAMGAFGQAPAEPFPPPRGACHIGTGEVGEVG